MGFRDPVTSLRADQLRPGTLPAGVLLPASQVSAGTLALAVVARAVAAGTIDALALADAAVTATKIGAGAVVAGTIAAGAIGTAELAADAITGKTITAGDIIGTLIRTATGGVHLALEPAQPRLALYTGRTDELDPGELGLIGGTVGGIGSVFLYSPTLTTPLGARSATLELRTDAATGATAARFDSTAVLAPNLTAGRAAVPFAEVERNVSNQAILANVFTAIFWDTRSGDADMTDAANATRLIAPVSGWYAITSVVIFQNAGSGASDTRAIRFKMTKAGVVTYARGISVPANVSTNFTELPALLYAQLAAGDFVEVQAWSNIALSVMSNQGTRTTMEWRRP